MKFIIKFFAVLIAHEKYLYAEFLKEERLNKKNIDKKGRVF
jgi:hypothetical protein